MQADTNLRTRIGRRIAAARALRELRQADLAEALGVNKFTVSKWERGIQLPDADTIYAMCKYLPTQNAHIPWPLVRGTCFYALRMA